MTVALRFPDDGSVVDATLDLQPGRRHVVFGPNGAGKTTMIRLLAGLLPSASPVVGPSAYLPQVPYAFRGSAGWNLALGLDDAGRDRARLLAGRLGVAGLLDRPARELSGGERQRLLLARTLARPEGWVMLDEPLAALDARDRMAVASVVVEEIGDRGAVIVTHDRQEAAVLGDVLAVVIGGRVAQQGPVGDVFALPDGPDVAAVVGIGNLFDGTVVVQAGPLCSVEVSGVSVWGVGDARVGGSVRVMFGAEAVTVFPGVDAPAGSARNRWIGDIVELRPAGRLVEAVIDVGITVVALLTPGAIDALDLAEGGRVTVAAKATAVRVIPA